MYRGGEGGGFGAWGGWGGGYRAAKTKIRRRNNLSQKHPQNTSAGRRISFADLQVLNIGLSLWVICWDILDRGWSTLERSGKQNAKFAPQHASGELVCAGLAFVFCSQVRGSGLIPTVLLGGIWTSTRFRSHFPPFAYFLATHKIHESQMHCRFSHL